MMADELKVMTMKMTTIMMMIIRAEGEALAKEWGENVLFFETSAKADIAVKEVIVFVFDFVFVFVLFFVFFTVIVCCLLSMWRSLRPQPRMTLPPRR